MNMNNGEGEGALAQAGGEFGTLSVRFFFLLSSSLV